MTMQRPIDTQNADFVSMQELGFERPERSSALMSCSPDCIKLLCPEGRITYMSHNGRCAMEICDLTQVLGANWWLLWPEHHHGLIQSAITEARAGRTANFIADCPTAGGREARWDVTVQGIFDDSGALYEIMAVSRETHEDPRPLTCI